jgi:hypothetical protein
MLVNISPFNGVRYLRQRNYEFTCPDETRRTIVRKNLIYSPGILMNFNVHIETDQRMARTMNSFFEVSDDVLNIYFVVMVIKVGDSGLWLV